MEDGVHAIETKNTLKTFKFGERPPEKMVPNLASGAIELQNKYYGTVVPRSQEDMQRLIGDGLVSMVIDNRTGKVMASAFMEPIAEGVYAMGGESSGDKFSYMRIFDQIKNGLKDRTLISFNSTKDYGSVLTDERLREHYKGAADMEERVRKSGMGFREYPVQEFRRHPKYGEIFETKYLRPFYERIKANNDERKLPTLDYEAFVQKCHDDGYAIYLREKQE